MEKTCIVAGCVIVNKGKILLLKHKKLGVWLYPGGHIEEGEMPTEAAIREAKEETRSKNRGRKEWAFHLSADGYCLHWTKRMHWNLCNPFSPSVRMSRMLQAVINTLI
ncbi:MAG: NUDIX hydrolase [Candidatus Marsarchaeota archaeon]|nr:NUDIX hydrolase [Candidatus Marsarchaeota archaeon]